MERIHAALAKARAERDSRHPALRLENPVPAADDAWAALPVISPATDRLAAHRLVAGKADDEAIPYDILRTRILQAMREKGWKRLAITSPHGSCGKTTTCLNLALSMTRQQDMRVLLIETDLRRPSMAGMLGIPDAPLFAEALAGACDPAEVLLRLGDNLAIGLNSRPSEDPSALLRGPSVRAALATLAERYRPDVMMFDMPPMLVSDDTIGFLEHVDCAALVVAADETKIQEVDICEQDLSARTNMLGVILNKARFVDAGYGYGYGGYGRD